jgi:hypothetical protein
VGLCYNKHQVRTGAQKMRDEDYQSLSLAAKVAYDVIRKAGYIIHSPAVIETEIERAKIHTKNQSSYDCLIAGGYEFIQAAPMDDGRFEVVMTKNGRTVTLLTDEPFVPTLSV